MHTIHETLDGIGAAICDLIGYPKDARKWRDDAVLRMMNELYPGLKQSYWYKVKYGAYLAGLPFRIRFID